MLLSNDDDDDDDGGDDNDHDADGAQSYSSIITIVIMRSSNNGACWCLRLMCCHIAKHTRMAAPHIQLQVRRLIYVLLQIQIHVHLPKGKAQSLLQYSRAYQNTEL